LDIQLELETKEGRRPLTFQYKRMVNGGYIGKNQEEVRRHIEELAAKGIPGPTSTPTLYPVLLNTLTNDDEIEVYGDKTSGEVEYVLLVKDANEIYVGLGSDHTDRFLEEFDIPRSKQVCPNVMSKVVWPLDEVSDHWDELVISSNVIHNGNTTRYQEGELGLLLNADELMDFVADKLSGQLKDIVIFSGTLGMIGGEFIYGERFSAELVDNKLNRRLSLDYKVVPMDYLSVD
jgi:hypothetical protein